MIFSILALAFMAVFCTAVAVWLAGDAIKGSPAAELKRRLQRMNRERETESGDAAAGLTREPHRIDRLLWRLPVYHKLVKKLEHAGLDVPVATFIAVAALLVIGSTAAAFALSRSLPAAIIVAGIASTAPFLFLHIKINRRVEKFTEVFPDALTMIARSLRAGHSFTSSVQLVGQEIADPVGEQFKTAYEQQLLGLRITEALDKMNERIESIDLRFFTTAVGINSDVGGRLAETLDNLAVTIRERLRIRRQVRVYTAQGRMSGYVLGALPIVTFIIFNLLNPSYEQVLYKEKMGKMILVLAAVMQLVGFLVIRRIIRIRI